MFMKNITNENTPQHSEDLLHSLSWKARRDYQEKGMTLVKCPNCNSVPQLFENDEFGFMMRCKCGSLGIGEKF